MANLVIDTIRTLAYTGISSSYAAVGGALTKTIRMFRLINNTDGDMIFSNDGTNPKLFCPANSFVLYDVAGNSPPQLQSSSMVVPIGWQWYVKESSSPSKGAVWIEGLTAQGV